MIQTAAKRWYIQLRTTRKLQSQSQMWERKMKSAALSQGTRAMVWKRSGREKRRAATSVCSPEMEPVESRFRAYHQPAITSGPAASSKEGIRILPGLLRQYRIG